MINYFCNKINIILWGDWVMKITKKAVASLSLVSVLSLGSIISPIQASQASAASDLFIPIKDSVTTSSETFIVDGNKVIFNFYEDNTIRRYEVIENGVSTITEFNKLDNSASIDGEKVDQAIVEKIRHSIGNGRSIGINASTGWVSAGTVKGSTKLATMTASAFAAFLASVVGGPVVSGLIAACSVVIGMGIPEVWFTDKQSFRMNGIYLETKHNISFYSNSARTKLIKSYSYITRDSGGPK